MLVISFNSRNHSITRLISSTKNGSNQRSILSVYGPYFRYECGLVWFVEWRCGEGSCVNGTALCDGKKERLWTLSYSISSSFVKEAFHLIYSILLVIRSEWPSLFWYFHFVWSVTKNLSEMKNMNRNESEKHTKNRNETFVCAPRDTKSKNM